MQYSREKHCQRTRRLIKYLNTQQLTYGETLLDKANSVRMCVMYGRTSNGQTELLQWDSKLQRNINEATKIALTYGYTLRRQDLYRMNILTYTETLSSINLSYECTNTLKTLGRPEQCRATVLTY